MIVKLLTEHHLEFLSLKGGCRGWSESTHVKIPHCWKSHVQAQFVNVKMNIDCMRCLATKTPKFHKFSNIRELCCHGNRIVNLNQGT